MNRKEARDLVKRAERKEFSTDDELNMTEEFTIGMKLPSGLVYSATLSEIVAMIIKKKTSEINTSYKKTTGRTGTGTRDIRVVEKAYSVNDEVIGDVIYHVFNFRFRDRVGECMKLFFIIPHMNESAALTVYTDKSIRRGPYDMEPQDDDPEWWMRSLRHEIYISLKTIGFQFDRPIDYTGNERLNTV
jgi:hypothetical protein